MLLPEMMQNPLFDLLCARRDAEAKRLGNSLDPSTFEVLQFHINWKADSRIYALDEGVQWALERTRPPEWQEDGDGYVAHALGARRGAAVWVQFGRPLMMTNPRHALVGCFIADAVKPDGMRTDVATSIMVHDSLPIAPNLIVVIGMTMRAEGVRFAFDYGRFSNVLNAHPPDVEENLVAYIALNFLAAMRYTKRLEAIEHKLPKASPKEERHERRTGRTRAPWTTIKLAVGGSDPPIQREIQTRAPAASADGTHAAPAAHWVTGHWHRYWVLQPDANDKPDATKEEEGRVLHRVARWLQPYFVDGPARESSAPRVAKVTLA